jgi:hypothetical protein
VDINSVNKTDINCGTLQVLNVRYAFFCGENCESQPLTFCDDIKGDVRIEFRRRVFHLTFYDIVFIRVDDLAIIRIVGEIYGKMERFSRDENSILRICENLRLYFLK